MKLSYWKSTTLVEWCVFVIFVTAKVYSDVQHKNLRLDFANWNMSYQRLFLEYAYPTKRWESSASSKPKLRLRLLQNEACGNTQNKTSIFNIKRAHMLNLCLQKKLDKEIHMMAREHGRVCSSMQTKQMMLWRENSRKLLPMQNHRLIDARSRQKSQKVPVNSSKKSKFLKLPSASSFFKESIPHDSNDLKKKWNTRVPTKNSKNKECFNKKLEPPLPFSTVNDFVIDRHYCDPVQLFSSNLNATDYKHTNLDAVGHVELLRITRDGKKNSFSSILSSWNV